MAALDQQLRQQMHGELKTIQSQVGITFVCVTHHQEEALALSDRLAVMQQGRVMQVGRPVDIYERPENLFVARFVGVTNEVHGVLTTGQDGERILSPREVSSPTEIRIPVSAGPQSGLPVALILRPERIRVMPGRASQSDANCLHGVVETMRYVGSEWQGVVRIGESIRWTIRVASATAGGCPFDAGAAVSLLWNHGDGVILPLT